MKTIAQQLNVTEFPFSIKDKNGNEIYWESSKGWWCKCEYDSNGNETYYENSNKYWSKSEYDSNGNVTYYESSEGYIVDNRPKGCEGKVIEIDGKKYKLTEV
jgi:hypothetical protein